MKAHEQETVLRGESAKVEVRRKVEQPRQPKKSVSRDGNGGWKGGEAEECIDLDGSDDGIGGKAGRDM